MLHKSTPLSQHSSRRETTKIPNCFELINLYLKYTHMQSGH